MRRPVFRTDKQYLNKAVSITPLVTFRILFGLLMLLSILRFWWRGWVTTVYILPKFHFTYTGFEWVQPLGAPGMHLIFGILTLTSLLICIGLFYRVSIVLFFLCFTYVELLDVTTYLNHYYFISLVSFILIWLPANRHYAGDVYLKLVKPRSQVPLWTIGIVRAQLAAVYIFAGLAKVNTDWLLDALPMRIWLPAKTHLPIVGSYMYQLWVAYVFSWFGAVYDLFIVFFLLNRKTRPVAYLFVLVFHIATAIFFPGIGMFPYVMIISSLVFFSGSFHKRILSFLPFYNKQGSALYTHNSYSYDHPKLMTIALSIYLFIQLIIPFRYLLYPGHLFWTEEGYRFSWRVMLMEKSGAAFFKVKDNGKTYEINNAAYLTPLQEKMMSTQPDMILKYAHYIAAQYRKNGYKEPEVYGEVYVALNGDRSRLFIDPSVNLAAEKLSYKHYKWILPYKK